MSLQVWLPLTKDLRQQGLSDVTVTNNGATFNSAGKLGGCYSFDGVDDRISCSSYTCTYPMSISAWFKPTDVTNTNTQYWLSYNTASGGTAGHAIAIGLYGAKLSIWYGGQVRSLSTAIANNVWYHIAVTIDANKKVITYLNGTQIDTVTFTSNNPGSAWLTLGARSNSNTGGVGGALYFYKGDINDARLYDHCLSPMEVKELAKGLVLHYPLNRQGWGQENLAKASTSATYMGSFPELKTLTFSGWDIYCNQNLDLTAAEWNALVGTKITYRLWLENVEQTVGTGTGIMLHFRFADGTYQQFGGGKNGTIGSWLAQGESGWVWLTVTVPDPTIRSTPTTISYVQYSIRHNSNNGVSTVRYKCAKVEKGSIATPWCPNSSDELATTMGLNSTTEYDCSGFCNNGTRTGAFTWTSDTPKYAVSQVFNGTDNAIQTPNLTTMITDKNYTIACWTYKTVIGTKNYQTIYGGPSGFELEARSSSSTSPLYRIHNWGGGTTTYNFGEWTHFCFVHTDSDSKLYVNGELKITGTSVNIPSGNYFVGAWKTSTSQNYEGNISDFRIYATALSADDVKSLYQNCATIDPDGTIRGQIRN